MNEEVFAEWFCQRHIHVIRTASTYWHAQGPRNYQAFPYHHILLPPEEELEQMLRKNNAIGLRYCTPIEAQSGLLSYQAVYEKPSYDFATLGKWARKNVRRGLRNCVVEQMPFEILIKEGFELQNDTLDRQDRHIRLSFKDWQQCWSAAANLPGFDAWGSFVNGRLAASVVTFRMNDCCYMLYQQCHREYMASHVNNALSFVVTQTMVKRPHFTSILYGLHSLDAPSSVDEFKFRMGYMAKPVRQRVVFHPWLRPLVNSATNTLVVALKQMWPYNATLSKAEGMIRFYRKGQEALKDQPIPAPFRNSNEICEAPS